MRTFVVLVIFQSVDCFFFSSSCSRPTAGHGMFLFPYRVFPVADGTKVYFLCGDGYEQVGGSWEVVCSGGQWTELTLRCEEVRCGHYYADVLNGDVEYTRGTVFGSTARLICNEGYTPIGRKEIFCRISGRWTDRLGECERISCDPPKPVTNGYFVPMKDEYQRSEVIHFRCNGEYVLNGPISSTCKNGRFNPAPPTCVLVNCPDPKVENGVAAGGAQPPYKFQSVVTFRCNVGHNMQGQDTVTCDINSQWSPALPECSSIVCDPPNPVTNGYFSPMKDEYQRSEVIHFRCNGEYVLNGSSSSKCENGRYNPAPPTCVLVNCPDPKIENGVAAGGARPPYRFQSLVMFRCNVGHNMQGQDTVTCDIDSQWSPALPKCISI